MQLTELRHATATRNPVHRSTDNKRLYRFGGISKALVHIPLLRHEVRAFTQQGVATDAVVFLHALPRATSAVIAPRLSRSGSSWTVSKVNTRNRKTKNAEPPK